jgi:1-deoxy-D-xylulose-5-phosphate synthase
MVNKKICAITAAMTEGTELRNFRQDFSERFFDVGIAEEHAAVFAAGLAVSGYIPVFAVYSSFLQRAYDYILHDIALQNLHVVCCVDRAGIVGEDGATHHGIFDVAFLNHIPNVTVFSPSSYGEFNKSFDFAVNEMDSPVFIRYPKGGEDEEFNKKLLGLSDVTDINADNNLNYIYIKNNNAKFLIITYGRISKTAFDVYLKLNKNNKPADFLKLNKIKPVDYILHEVMKSCIEVKNVIFIEEGIECGGVAEHIASNLKKSGADKNIRIFAVNDFIEQGTVGQLFEACGFNPEKIYNNITEI